LPDKGIAVVTDRRLRERGVEIIKRIAAVVADAGVDRQTILIGIIQCTQIIILDDGAVVLYVITSTESMSR
jgi:hypothetical protein